MGEIETRLNKLEDIQAIKDVLTHYAYYADQNEEKGKQNIHELAALFTEDGIWEMPGVVKAKGRKELINFFKSLSDGHDVLAHYVMPPFLNIEGDTASTISNLLAYIIPKGSEKATSSHSFYDIKYVKTESGWKMKHLVLKSSFSEPLH